MKKKFSMKKYLLFLAGVGLLCIMAVLLTNGLQKRQNGKQFEKLLSKLTYQAEARGKELDMLEEFSPVVEDMSHRNQAVYYRTLTKFYMLRGDTDRALLSFVDAELNAEISKAYDVAAWLYLEIAQVYVDLDAAPIAMECVNTALEYADMQPMEDFFYEYAHLVRAEMQAKQGEIEEAEKSYYQSLEYASAEKMPEYHSIEQRQNLVMAAIMLQSGRTEAAEEYLHKLETYMQELEYLPADALWFSAIYYPYLTRQTKFCLQKGAYEAAADYMDEAFATGFLYGQVNGLMNFTNEILSFTEGLEEETLPEELNQSIKANIQKLILEFPKAFQNKNNITATHIYNSNMITIAVFVQKYETERLYWMIAEGVAVVALVILLLIFLIRRTESKGRVDGLTGAYIRRYFNEVYENLKNGTSEFGVIMYDIDFFKQINDGFGHDAGDWVLRETAHLVTSLLDNSSQLFRYGGDEFCIICKKKSLEEMAELAETIRSSVEKMKWHEGMKVSFSIGVAVASQSPERDVMAKVDEKLYASKEAGRNYVSW